MSSAFSQDVCNEMIAMAGGLKPGNIELAQNAVVVVDDGEGGAGVTEPRMVTIRFDIHRLAQILDVKDVAPDDFLDSIETRLTQLRSELQAKDNMIDQRQRRRSPESLSASVGDDTRNADNESSPTMRYLMRRAHEEPRFPRST